MPNNDLIRRKALYAAWDNIDAMEFNDQNLRIDEMIRLTQAAPAVDAVEVVRCKDCAHYHDELCGKIQWIMDGYYTGTFESKQPLDFCSQAEKKGQSK